jgi:hypothetical protein
MGSGLATSTSRSYRIGFEAFLAFRFSSAATGRQVESEWSLVRDPNNEAAWCAFVLHLKVIRRVKSDTARKYLAGARYCLLAEGIQVVFKDMAILKLVLKSWKKEEGPALRKKKILWRDITAILNLKPDSSVMAKRKWNDMCALIVVGFKGLARLGEITGAFAPRVKSVVHTKSGAWLIKIDRSKGDPFCQGAVISISGHAADAALKHAMHNKRPSDYLFAGSSLSQPILREEFITWLKSSLARVGNKQAHEVSGHSLRRGGAQHLWDAGMPLEELKRKGRWASDAFRVYINTQIRDEAAVVNSEEASEYPGFST